MRLASVARIDLGMSLEEFLGVTPRMFARLLETKRRRRDRDDSLVERIVRTVEIMVAQQIAMTGNTGFARFKEIRTPQEFMPSQWAKTGTRRERRLSRRQREAAMWEKYGAMKEAYLKNAAKVGLQVTGVTD